MRGALFLAAGCLVAVLTGGLLLGASNAGNLLANGDFAAWSGGKPAGWTATGSVTPAEGGGALLTSGSRLAQTVELGGGVQYRAVVEARGVAGSPSVTLNLDFRDDLFLTVHQASTTQQLSASTGTLSLEELAPASTAYVTISIATANGDAQLMSASLLVAAVPSPTPTEPPPTATPTPTPKATASASATSTAKATTTASATPTRTATPARTPSSTRTTAPTRTPTPRASATRSPTSEPTVPTTPAGGAGGLLQNGDFELVIGGAPRFWAKFGGEMRSVGGAKSGEYAVALDSVTASTKWVHQVVRVEPGCWYRADGFARLESGEGRAYIRVSWYASVDGGGSQMAQSDSADTSARTWTELTTGAVQAPAGARSARMRLMLSPSGPATAHFDDVSFEEVEEPQSWEVVLPGLASDRGWADARTLSFEREGQGAVVRAEARQADAGLRLSEVLPDPEQSGRDGPYEWVEIENAGTEPVDLAGWQLGDATRLQTLPAFKVPPGGRVVIAGASAVLPEGAAVVRVPGGQVGNGLNNDGDTVRLVAPDGTVVDTLTYGDGGAAPAPGAGETLARAPDGKWRISSKATPGSANEFAANAGGPGTATAGSSPPRQTSEQPTAAQEPAPVRLETGGEGASPIPWIVLGAAAGAGGIGAVAVARRAWPALAERLPRR